MCVPLDPPWAYETRWLGDSSSEARHVRGAAELQPCSILGFWPLRQRASASATHTAPGPGPVDSDHLGLRARLREKPFQIYARRPHLAHHRRASFSCLED
jgi:hypothetical protein